MKQSNTPAAPRGYRVAATIKLPRATWPDEIEQAADELLTRSDHGNETTFTITLRAIAHAMRQENARMLDDERDFTPPAREEVADATDVLSSDALAEQLASTVAAWNAGAADDPEDEGGPAAYMLQVVSILRMFSTLTATLYKAPPRPMAAASMYAATREALPDVSPDDAAELMWALSRLLEDAASEGDSKEGGDA